MTSRSDSVGWFSQTFYSLASLLPRYPVYVLRRSRNALPVQYYERVVYLHEAYEIEHDSHLAGQDLSVVDPSTLPPS